jgi:hypothetical protein
MREMGRGRWFCLGGGVVCGDKGFVVANNKAGCHIYTVIGHRTYVV